MKYVAKTNLFAGKTRLIPNQLVPEGLYSEDELKKLLDRGFIATVELTVVEPIAPPPAPEVPDPAAWAFDADTLKGKTVEQLNMLAAQHVKKHGIAPVEPFDDLDEAVAFMSKDRK